MNGLNSCHCSWESFGTEYYPLVYVTCRFKTFGRFETAMAILIPLQGLEMAWPFQNDQLFLLAVLIPHQFDIGRQACSVAFKYNSCYTIKTYMFIRTAFGLL